MNITIKITHANGTVMDISIPVAIEQPVKTPATEVSAVVTPEDEVAASEPAIPAQDAPSACHEVEQVLSYEATKQDLQPNGKRFKSVSDMVADLAIQLRAEEVAESSRENTLGREKVGEDEEGAGRIGGMGERKGEGGEGEGEEGHLEQFKCSDGAYVIPPSLYSDFCSAFGKVTVDHQLTLARLWAETNPQRRKTRRGMGRFLNAWLCRAQGEKRVSLKARSGSLLETIPSQEEAW